MNRNVSPRFSLFFACVYFACVPVYTAYLEGDVILGGLFAIHLENSEGKCTDLDLKGLGRAQAMIFAVEKINNDSNVLPNLTLGYDIRDYCGNVSKATKITYDLIRESSTYNKNGDVRKPMVAIVGPKESSTALAIGGLLQVFGISGISGTTTSPELSSQTYNHFYRTIPSDNFRVKAIADIIQHFNWTYVAAVGLDDSYGRNGVWSLVEEAARRNHNFCVAVTEFIRRKRQVQSIRNIVTKLKQHRNVRVIVLWIHGSYEKTFRDEVDIQNLSGRVWFLSEGQGTELNFFLDPGYLVLDGSIGLQPHNFSDAGFRENVKYLNEETSGNCSKEWWREYWDLRERNCLLNVNSEVDFKDEVALSLCSRDAVELIYTSYVPYIIDAVYAVATAIQNFIKDNRCHQNACNISKEAVQRFLPAVNFGGLTGRIKFDEHGDPTETLFDIVNFQPIKESSVKQLEQVVVGKWQVDQQNIKRLRFDNKVLWNAAIGISTTPRSDCVDQCAAGTRKSVTSPCCWQCIPCLPGTFNPIVGSSICTKCPKETHSKEAKTKCIDLPLVNVQYSSAAGAVLLAFAAGGIFAILFALAVFCRFWNCPIIKASNRELSLFLLVGNILLFSLVLVNLFEPTDTLCKIIYPLRYITYNICLSILLVKVLRISSAFEVPVVPWLKISLHNARPQVVMLTILHVLLLAMILPWLLLDPSSKERFVFPEKHIFIECKGYKTVFGKSLFLLTCGYIFFQILICAVGAFRIRNIPENFSETKRLAFSIYIFLLSFIVYHPVEFSMHGWYVTIVDCVTTMMSAYGFLCCIFLPKIYIILFRSELYNAETIRHELSRYSFESNAAHLKPMAINPVTPKSSDASN